MAACSFSISMSFLFCLLAFSLFPHSTMAQEILIKTPADYEGPFYPVNRQQDEDNDLIHVSGQPHPAQGDILLLSGVVLNTGSQPLHNAMVEIWQTDPNGLYKDHRDKSPGRRNSNFQYWGKAATKADGSFSFTTLLPGKYEPRPAHIHFKVWIDDKTVLTSQIYFRNHSEETRKSPSSMTNDLQTVDLQETQSGEFKAFIRIVL